MVRNWGAATALLALICVVGFALWLDVSSPLYQCQDAANHCGQAAENNNRSTDYVAVAFVVAKFVQTYNGALSAVASIFIAAFTIVLAVTTRGLNQATRGLQRFAAVQADDMKKSIAIASRQADATAIAAEAARANSQMLIDTERARLIVFVVDLNLGHIDGINNLGGVRPEQPLREPIELGLKFRNYGRTPAIISMVAWRIETNGPRTTPNWVGLRAFEPAADAIIDGNGVSNVFKFRMPGAISVQRARDVRDGRAVLDCYGYVRFSDIFGESYEGRFWLQYEAPADYIDDGGMGLIMYEETKTKK
jgi:hypothetical protein